MKRMSIAEQTLNKQVAGINREIDEYLRQIDLLNERIESMRSIRTFMQDEMSRLASARLAASTSRKS